MDQTIRTSDTRWHVWTSDTLDTLEQVIRDEEDINPSGNVNKIEEKRVQVKYKTQSENGKNIQKKYHCIHCLTKNKHFASDCFALNLKCKICSKVGHVAKGCKGKQNYIKKGGSFKFKLFAVETRRRRWISIHLNEYSPSTRQPVFLTCMSRCEYMHVRCVIEVYMHVRCVEEWITSRGVNHCTLNHRCESIIHWRCVSHQCLPNCYAPAQCHYTYNRFHILGDEPVEPAGLRWHLKHQLPEKEGTCNRNGRLYIFHNKRYILCGWLNVRSFCSSQFQN